MLLDYLSENLLLEPSFIGMISDSSSNRYKRIVIKKKNGSDRIIYQPARELKAIQRFLHDTILNRLPIHTAAHAYRIGFNLKHHALVHKKGNYLTRLDFKNFFNSIDQNDVRSFINDNSKCLNNDWSDEDTELLIKLVCYKGALTIGSVTSPVISNCICYKLDERISQICNESKVTYSRYADDLYFSTIEANILFTISSKIIKILRELDYPKNLWLNKKKTIHSSKKHQRRITGIVLTEKGDISIGRGKKRKVRSQIFNWPNLTEKERISLKGYLAFVSSIEPEFINRLCIKYGSLRINNIIKYCES